MPLDKARIPFATLMTPRDTVAGKSMTSHEHGGPAPEQEPQQYTKAGRFPNERSSGRAYQAAQDTIFRSACELSTFRLQLNHQWHVAVIGESPPATVEQALESIFGDSEPVTLPQEVLDHLEERRQRAIRRAPWTERHYRP